MGADGLNRVRSRMSAAADRCGRSIEDVRLVVVSKGRRVEAIMELYESGHRDFGENRAQELVDKAALLPEDIVWHFVGPVQRRKVKLIRPITALLHSMDRPSLGAAWARGSEPAPPSLLEVNIANEPQKHGAAPDAVPEMLEELAAVGIRPEGLMVIPPVPSHAEDSRPWFRALALLRRQLAPAHPQLRELSMGMTDDFEVAVEEGATLIRVGRAIFDPIAGQALGD